MGLEIRIPPTSVMSVRRHSLFRLPTSVLKKVQVLHMLSKSISRTLDLSGFLKGEVFFSFYAISNNTFHEWLDLVVINPRICSFNSLSAPMAVLKIDLTFLRPATNLCSHCKNVSRLKATSLWTTLLTILVIMVLNVSMYLQNPTQLKIRFLSDEFASTTQYPELHILFNVITRSLWATDLWWCFIIKSVTFLIFVIILDTCNKCLKMNFQTFSHFWW